MTKFILHGGFTREENESNRLFFVEFMSGLTEGDTILLVLFATRDEKEKPMQCEDFMRHCREVTSEQNFNFILATEEHFLQEIEVSKAVFFNGGSTNKLMTVLRTYENFKSLLTDKTVAGSSAGAYALAQMGTSHDEEIFREGLGFVPIRVVCHYQSPTLPPFGASVEILKNTSPELELLYLKDYEWKVFNS